jgi:acetyl-CoA carboxylase beta subunit
MSDGDSSPKIKLDSDISKCVSCHREIYFNELFSAHGMCSQCLADGFEEHNGG